MSSSSEKKVDLDRRAFLRGRFLGYGSAENDGGAPVAVLDRGSCIAWDGVICISCRLACEPQAIAFENRRPTIIFNACTGCGDCIKLCPTQAIRLK